ncbi:MAG: DnaB-like helicase C-terminal domain-containing protein, partial [Oscillospiraceae bacterium]|nr:DnaB-like helicase C-terminal domain-containing protein [Oscillospiraceae bacterium]
DAEYKGLASGWDSFDQMSLIERGCVTIIAARPGGGKTDFSVNLVTRLALRFHVSYFTLEMTRPQLLNRIASRITKINSNVIRTHQTTATQKASVFKALELMQAQLHLIIDDKARLTIDELENKIIAQRPDVIFIDHVGLMQGSNPYTKKVEVLTEITGRLKEIAKKYNIAVVQLVQINREQEKRKGAPTMADLKGSGSFEEDCDSALFICPEITPAKDSPADEDYIQVQVRIAKNRNGPQTTLYYCWQQQFHAWQPLSYIYDDFKEVAQTPQQITFAG